MPAPFDLAAYTRTAFGSHREAIEGFGEVGSLPAEERDLVRLVRDLEAGTMPYLRRVLVTPTHRDARVTAFLVTWAFERFWIADALTALLERAGGTDAPHDTDATSGRDGGASGARRARRARRGPVARAVGSMFAGPDLVAAHLASLATSEAVTRAAYARLAASTPSPAAGALYRRLDAVHARQCAFLDAEASARLAASPRAVRLARRELRGERYPLGMADRPGADAARFARAVFPSGAAGAAAALAAPGALPGIDRDTIDAVAGRLARAAP